MKTHWNFLWPCILVVLVHEVASAGVTTGAFLTPADRQRLKQVFINALASGDLPAIHYSVVGLGLLSEKVPNPQNVCKSINAAISGSTSPEALYHVADTWKHLGSCGNLPEAVSKGLSDALEKPDSTMPNLFYSVQGLYSLGKKPKDQAALIKSLQAAIKKDDSLINLGYLFHVASAVGSGVSFAVDRIEDAIVQADEVDRRMLQFEGGLSITALIVSGAYKLATVVDQKPPMTGDQAVKFANYFMGRRSVQLPKGSYSLLEVLQTLTTNKFHQPVAVTLAGTSAVSADSPSVNVRISDLLGRPLGPLVVSADTVTRLGDGVVELANAALAPVPGDSSLYSLDLYRAMPKRGFYRLSLSAKPSKADARLVGHSGAPLEVKVLGTVAVETAEIGLADADQTTAPKLNRVSYPGKASVVVEADSHQRLLMRFVLNDKSTKQPITVHQAFVKLTNQATAQEIIFVAEPDTSKAYRFDMDIGARAADFGHMSGRYTLALFVGDAVLSNSFAWDVAEIALTFSSGSSSSDSESQKTDVYKPKPEIKHLFREPDSRPPATVSSLFTVLVCLPLLVLLVLWAKVGVNISNFPCSLSALGFHLGLGGIFCLFTVFWLQLNMFQTLKYLLGVGIITFLCGNKMLSKLANSHNQS